MRRELAAMACPPRNDHDAFLGKAHASGTPRGEPDAPAGGTTLVSAPAWALRRLPGRRAALARESAALLRGSAELPRGRVRLQAQGRRRPRSAAPLEHLGSRR